MKKKLIAILTAATMAVTMLPSLAFANESGRSSTVTLTSDWSTLSAFGSADDLKEFVNVNVDSVTMNGSTAKFTTKEGQKLPYKTGFKKFNTEKPAEQSGNYIAYCIQFGETITQDTKVKLVKGEGGASDKTVSWDNFDKTAGSSEKDSLNIMQRVPAESRTITVDYDGDGDAEETLTIDFQGLSCETEAEYKARIAAKLELVENPQSVFGEWLKVEGLNDFVNKYITAASSEDGTTLTLKTEDGKFLPYKTEFKEFNGTVAEEQEGNYAAYTIKANPSKVTDTWKAQEKGNSSAKELKGAANDPEISVLQRLKDNEASKTYTITYDNGAETDEVTINFTDVKKVTKKDYTEGMAVVAQIKAIVENLTADSSDAISTAKSAYEALEAAGKSVVTNYEDLEAADITCQALVIEKAINAIGPVTADTYKDAKSKIDAAREAYEDADRAVKAEVRNLQVLVSAEKAYDKFAGEAEGSFNEALAGVNEKIAAVKALTADGKTISHDDEAVIKAAEDAITAFDETYSDKTASITNEDRKAVEDARKALEALAAISIMEGDTIDSTFNGWEFEGKKSDFINKNIVKDSFRKNVLTLKTEDGTKLPFMAFKGYWPGSPAEYEANFIAFSVKANDTAKTENGYQVSARSDSQSSVEKSVEVAKGDTADWVYRLKDDTKNITITVTYKDNTTEVYTINVEGVALQSKDEATAAGSAQAVLDQIAALDKEITLADEEAVTAARDAYKALSDEAKKLITSEKLEPLVKAEARIKALKESKAAAEAFDAKVKALEELSLPGEVSEKAHIDEVSAQIDSLQDEFAALNAEVQSFVTTYGLLDVKAEARDAAKMKYTALMIEAIPEKDLSKPESFDNETIAAIEAAMKAYDEYLVNEDRNQDLRNAFDQAYDDAQQALTDAKDALAHYEAYVAQYNLNQVIKMINALPAAGSITVNDENQILAARAAYEALDEADQAELADELEILKAAETALGNAKKAAAAAAEARQLKNAKVTIAAQTYTGAARTPAVKVVDKAGKIVDPKNYMVIYQNNINAGTAKATIIAVSNGSYEGYKEAAFKIAAKSISGASVSGIKNKTYSGKSQTQSVKVVAAGRTLANGRDYTVSYSSNKAVGKATLKITAKGNYTGSITKTFRITPAKGTISSLKAGKRKMTVKVKAQSGAKYQIAYKLKGSKKYKYVTSSKTTKSISKLKKGRTYTVKVRAFKKIDGKNYYGSYSKTKNIRVK